MWEVHRLEGWKGWKGLSGGMLWSKEKIVFQNFNVVSKFLKQRLSRQFTSWNMQTKKEGVMAIKNSFILHSFNEHKPEPLSYNSAFPT